MPSYLEYTVQQRTQQLRIAKENTDKANASKAEFFSNMLHDLRTPLHGILSFAAIDPGEQSNVAQERPEIVQYLEARLIAYAKIRKPAEWIRSQPQFLGAHGNTVFNPDFDINDRGLPNEKTLLPTK